MSKRDFPCKTCGANVAFSPGVQDLLCPYCGGENHIPQSEEEVKELDFHEALAKGAETAEVEQLAVRCGACGAQVTLEENVTSSRCPFCDNPIVAQAESTRLLQPQSLLPFQVQKKQAQDAFEKWLSTRWFAPNNLKNRARTGSIDGVYMPYWTYDCKTESFYRGQRGEYYYVRESYTTQENGKTVTKTRQVRHTRWYDASGVVWLPFDDVLILGSHSLPKKLSTALEPWDLEALVPYDDRYLAGFQSECYQIDLPQGFEAAKEIMAGAIEARVRNDIGGDVQQVSSVRSQHSEISYKHILLPLWISAYRYGGKPLRFLVNARTGEVQGERPYSWVKITFTVIVAVGLIAALVAIFR